MRTLAILNFVVVLSVFAQTAPNPELHKLFREFYEGNLREFPEFATSAGRNEYNDKWADYSPKSMAAAVSRRRDVQKRLEGFRGANLNPQDRLSVELLDYELRTD